MWYGCLHPQLYVNAILIVCENKTPGNLFLLSYKQKKHNTSVYKKNSNRMVSIVKFMLLIFVKVTMSQRDNDCKKLMLPENFTSNIPDIINQSETITFKPGSQINHIIFNNRFLLNETIFQISLKEQLFLNPTNKNFPRPGSISLIHPLLDQHNQTNLTLTLYVNWNNERLCLLLGSCLVSNESTDDYIVLACCNKALDIGGFSYPDYMKLMDIPSDHTNNLECHENFEVMFFGGEFTTIEMTDLNHWKTYCTFIILGLIFVILTATIISIVKLNRKTSTITILMQ